MPMSGMNISSLYSTAQCLLSVVGSVGVILLFAGIPQLIYAPAVDPSKLVTFLIGATLITAMVAGNAFLNYKFRQQTRSGTRQEQGTNSAGYLGTSSTACRVQEDKPPSYDDLAKLDGSPPDYFAILKEKPPRYEEVISIASQGPSSANATVELSAVEGIVNPTFCLTGHPYDDSTVVDLTGCEDCSVSEYLSSGPASKNSLENKTTAPTTQMDAAQVSDYQRITKIESSGQSEEKEQLCLEPNIGPKEGSIAYISEAIDKLTYTVEGACNQPPLEDQKTLLNTITSCDYSCDRETSGTLADSLPKCDTEIQDQNEEVIIVDMVAQMEDVSTARETACTVICINTVGFSDTSGDKGPNLDTEKEVNI